MKKRAFLLTIGAIAAVGAMTGCTPTKYQNCDAVHKVYKGGIAKPGYHQTGMVTKYAPKVDQALYDANKGLDRDKDGVACEA
jgi:hypothetical protein